VYVCILYLCGMCIEDVYSICVYEHVCICVCIDDECMDVLCVCMLPYHSDVGGGKRRRSFHM
jgi:hypothetical protein